MVLVSSDPSLDIKSFVNTQLTVIPFLDRTVQYRLQLYSGYLKSDHWKYRLFEDGNPNGPVFKELGYASAIVMVPTI